VAAVMCGANVTLAQVNAWQEKLLHPATS
jgi:hypothetical protein